MIRQANRLSKCLMAFMAGAMVLSGCGQSAFTPRAQGLSAGVGARIFKGDSTMSLLVMPESGVAPIVEAIRQAKKSIKLHMYMFTNSKASAEIAQALVERAKAGLDVQVMVEVRAYIPAGAPKCEASDMNVNAKAIEVLAAGGVRVKYSSPKFVYSHVKSMLIDDAVGFVMNSNFTNSAFVANREYVIVTREPSDVAELGRIYKADWNETGYQVKDPDFVVSPNNSRKQLLDLIDSAQKTLTIQIEFFTDPEAAAHVAERVKAGVDVTVMLSYQEKDKCNGSDVNADEAKLITGAGVTKLAFIKHLKLHAKTIIADEARAYVGSENLSSNSLDNNREVGILVRDPEIVSTLVRTTKKDWDLRNSGKAKPGSEL